MDKRFVAHRDYLDNQENISCVLLRSCLLHALPRRLDSLEYVDEMPDAETIASFDGNVIPVGDLAWVRQWLSNVPGAADPTLTPIEIPDAMLPFAGREYFRSLGRDIDEAHLSTERYFIKDVDTLKRWNSLLYNGEVAGLIEPGTTYSVSEKVSFLSEWRVFVFEDAERGAYSYLGDPMLFPDADAIHEMVTAWKEDALAARPRAYTLDVGVISSPDDPRADGQGHVTVPIEVHPFVACGLYGFDDAAVIADMLVAGYEWYRDEAARDVRGTGESA